MRLIIILFSLIVLTIGIKLQVPSKITLTNSYELTCSGGNGDIKYSAENLPNGVELQDNHLYIVSENSAHGYFPVKVGAVDMSGEKDEKIIVIFIQRQTDKKQHSPKQSQQKAQSQTVMKVDGSMEKQEGKVNEVLDSYNVNDGMSGNFVYPEQGYPKIKMPTGGDPNSINHTPQKIRDQQQKPSNSNRNKITEDDVRTNAIFERQLNAAKALANLLDILRQATANRNAAIEEVNKRQKIYQSAITKERESKEAVIKAESYLTRIKVGIETITQRIVEARNIIAKYQDSIKQLNIQRDEFSATMQQKYENLSGINQMIERNREILSQFTSSSEEQQKNCAGHEKQFQQANNILRSHETKINALNKQISVNEESIQTRKQRVIALRRQLAEEQNNLEENEKDLISLREIKQSLENQMNFNKNLANTLDVKIRFCRESAEGVERQMNKIANQIIPALEFQKNGQERQIQELQNKIDSLNQEINNNLPQKILEVQGNIEKFNYDLGYLRNYLMLSDRVLKKAYEAGNEAQVALKQAENNLNAAKKRFEEEERIIEEVTKNIEEAREEKEEADLAVEELLKEQANILPYVSSAKYEINEDGSIKMKSWNSYVEDVYGSNVRSFYTGDVQNLYPFKISSNVSEEGCSEENMESFSGFVIMVSSKSLRVISSGEIINIFFSDCTKSYASSIDYKTQAGDLVVGKGKKTGKNFNANSLSFIDYETLN